MSTVAAQDALSESHSSFLRNRLGSLLAVAPLGVWVVAHIWHNLAAFQGEEAWKEAVTTYPHPIAQVLSAVVAILPIVVHTVWGISRMAKAQPNNHRYGFLANARYILQRVSAVGILLFVGAHLWLATLHPRLVEGHAEEFSDIAAHMHHHPPTLIVYLLGTLGVGYHLANGLQTFAMGWGIVSSRRALKKADLIGYAFFAVFMAMAWGAVYALWSAGASFPNPEP